MFSYQALICACSCSCFKWSRSWITPLCTLWHKLVRLLSTVSFTVNPHSHSSASVWEGRRASASQAAAVRHRTVPAIPCRRLFLVSERRNCGGAVQLSELEQKQEKKEKALLNLSLQYPWFHPFITVSPYFSPLLTQRYCLQLFYQTYSWVEAAILARVVSKYPAVWSAAFWLTHLVLGRLECNGLQSLGCYFQTLTAPKL